MTTSNTRTCSSSSSSTGPISFQQRTKLLYRILFPSAHQFRVDAEFDRTHRHRSIEMPLRFHRLAELFKAAIDGGENAAENAEDEEKYDE